VNEINYVPYSVWYAEAGGADQRKAALNKIPDLSPE